MIKIPLMAVVSFLTIVGGLFAAPANHKPIRELKDLRVEEAVYTDASRTKPLVLKSLENGAKYFEDEALAAISKTVDFEKQIVLLFAWKGSGKDRLQHVVMKPSPEKIIFSYNYGSTKDLKPHVKVYVLQSNVKWAVE